MLDVHIADSFDTATRNDPVVRIDLNVHAAFFNERITLANDCPYLERMSDYFSDCTFAGADLQALLGEIDTVSKRIMATSPHQTWIKQLHDACQTAMANGDSIFVLCD